MKKLTIVLALAVAAVATAGMMTHSQNPLLVNGKALTMPHEFPYPPCPPACALPSRP